jgi:hypothetical protein
VDTPDTTIYHKCDAGKVPSTFGNIFYQGWRDRDGLDILFANLIVDYWSEFARTRQMDMEPGYLEAHGFHKTKAKIVQART